MNSRQKESFDSQNSVPKMRPNLVDEDSPEIEGNVDSSDSGNMKKTNNKRISWKLNYSTWTCSWEEDPEEELAVWLPFLSKKSYPEGILFWLEMKTLFVSLPSFCQTSCVKEPTLDETLENMSDNEWTHIVISSKYLLEMSCFHVLLEYTFEEPRVLFSSRHFVSTTSNPASQDSEYFSCKSSTSTKLSSTPFAFKSETRRSSGEGSNEGYFQLLVTLRMLQKENDIDDDNVNWRSTSSRASREHNPYSGNVIKEVTSR